MKKILIIFIAIFSLFCITGCGKKEEVKEEPKTVANMLSETFKEVIETEKNIEKVAKTIAENEIIVPEVQTFTIAKGDYLAGFKEEIKGFKKAVGIAPMINTIPLIAYVFEVEETESFTKSLEENADLRWNICTQADEKKITVVDNYIFFIMSPNSFEE